MEKKPISPVQEDDPRPSPLPGRPRFDQSHYVDRGYYLVVEFQDEKRRRDRAAAVEVARRHPHYQCLMTAEHRLLHRTVYRRQEMPLFLELYNNITTWTSPRYYVMGYPIAVSELMRGVECFGRMGQTCNLLSSHDGGAHPTYFGCPRSSVSFKLDHPRAWFRLFYERDPDEARRWLRLESSLDEEEALEDPKRLGGCAELRAVARSYCGCPLIHLPRLQETYERLPEAIELDDEHWQYEADGLQPNEELYVELLARLELGRLPCSDRDPFEQKSSDSEDVEGDGRARRRRRAAVTWLDD